MKTPEVRMISRRRTPRQITMRLDELIAEHREVLVLRFIESMTYEQIARIVGCQQHGAAHASITPTMRLRALLKGPNEMTEKDLRKALLGLDAAAIAGVPDAQQITRKVLDRDRRRVQLLAALTIFLWLTAALGIVVVLSALLFVHPSMLQTIRGRGHGRRARRSSSTSA